MRGGNKAWCRYQAHMGKSDEEEGKSYSALKQGDMGGKLGKRGKKLTNIPLPEQGEFYISLVLLYLSQLYLALIL